MKPKVIPRFFTLLVLLVGLITNASAALFELTIQPIQLRMDDGSNPVSVIPFFYESEVNAIWAQAGINVTFLPIKIFDSTAYRDLSNPETGQVTQVPTSDAGFEALIAPLSLQDSTLQMFFVNSHPGTGGEGVALSDFSSSGIATVGGRRSVMANSPNPFTGFGSVLAHEIGHNLGLVHQETGAGEFNNLMRATSGGTYLDADQISLAQTTGQSLGVLVAVPEPYEYAIFAGFGLLGFACFHRAQKRPRPPVNCARPDLAVI